jgi:hypothetical protein
MTVTVPSLAALRDIFLDANVSARSRVEAAEAVLSYESPEGLVSEAKAFLTTVFEDPDTLVTIRLDALKVIRKAEARKVTQPASNDDRAGRELGRELLIARRRLKLAEAGLWPPPKGWADDLLSSDFIPPYVDPNPDNLAERLKAAREAHAKKLKGEL